MVSINYELKICGAKHPNASTMTHVKVKLKDLSELETDGKYKQFYRSPEKISQVMQLRKSTQLELVKQELAVKEAQRIHANQEKNNDLEFLKSYGGSFIEDSNVNAFLKLNNFGDEKTELNMLYYQDICSFVDLLKKYSPRIDFVFCHVPPDVFSLHYLEDFFHQNKK